MADILVKMSQNHRGHGIAILTVIDSHGAACKELTYDEVKNLTDRLHSLLVAWPQVGRS